MGYIVRLPKLGLEMQEGTLLEWFVSEGEAISQGDVIAEFETEKTVGEVEARESGVLKEIFISEGEASSPGAPIAIIARESENIEELHATVESEIEQRGTERESEESSGRAQDSESDRATQSDGVKVSPRAKRRANELGVTLNEVEGTGPQGAITVDDIEATNETMSESSFASRTLIEERKLSTTRETIAERLGESYRNAIHVTEDIEVDAKNILLAAEEASSYYNQKITISDILLKCLSSALDEHEIINATFEDGVVRIFREHNVNIAVDSDRGLISPTLHQVEEKSVDEIANKRATLIEKVGNSDIDTADLEGGTFTVTNLGPFGIKSFTPIINPPQVAILGVNALEPKTGPETIIPKGEQFRDQVLPLSLSFDHRVIDGADAARFLRTLQTNIEDPWNLLSVDLGPDRETEGGKKGAKPRHVIARRMAKLSGQIDTGSGRIEFDEPTDLGGSGEAPSPVDLFLGALASCIANSIDFQAEKREVDIDSLDVVVDASPGTGPVESISVTIDVSTSESRDDLDRLIDLARRMCYVSGLLKDELPIKFSIKGDR